MTGGKVEGLAEKCCHWRKLPTAAFSLLLQPCRALVTLRYTVGLLWTALQICISTKYSKNLSNSDTCSVISLNSFIQDKDTLPAQIKEVRGSKQLHAAGRHIRCTDNAQKQVASHDLATNLYFCDPDQMTSKPRLHKLHNCTPQINSSVMSSSPNYC